MNKRELIARVQRHMGAGASREAAGAAVNAVLESILQTAREEEKAHVAHLGIFEYRHHQCRDGRGLPTTAQPGRALRRLCFRPADSLKQRCTRP